MRRAFVIPTAALALALLPAAVFAQTPPAQQPPAGQTPAGQPPAGQPPAGQTPPAAAAPEQPAAAKTTFKAPTGVMLVTVRGDQGAAFEEMVAKLRAAASSTDPAVKAGGTVKVWKAAESAAGGNLLYVMLYDPAVPGTEYSWLDVINNSLTDDQKRDPATREMYKRFAAAIVSTNLLNLTPVGGGM